MSDAKTASTTQTKAETKAKPETKAAAPPPSGVAVVMRGTYATPTGTYRPGQVCRFPKAVAEALVKARQADVS
jgi:hypothetical protein